MVTLFPRGLIVSCISLLSEQLKYVHLSLLFVRLKCTITGVARWSSKITNVVLARGMVRS